MSAHTPGPWFQSHRENKEGMWNTQVYDAKGETIATLAWYPVPQHNGVIETSREANAHLIAAAPEMLEALKAMLHIFSPKPNQGIVIDCIVKAKWAVEKAEGRS